MSRCVPDSDELHDPPPMYQEEELFAYADNNLPCWSDCGMWDVDLKWVDGRPGLVSVGSWKDDTPHSIVDQATGDTILDHTAPSFDASSSDSKNLISWFDSHDHTGNTSSTVWPVIMDTVGVVAAGTQEDALVPAYQNVDKPTSVHGRRVADKRPAEGNAPACRNHGRSRSVAPKDRQGRVPPGIPDEVTRRVERPDKKPRKAVDQIVDKAPSSVSTKRSRAAADHHNLSERRRRNKFNEKLRTLQKLIPHAASKGDKVSVLDEVISYTKRLQSQADMMTATYSPVMMMANVMNNPMVTAAAATMAHQFQLASAAQMAQLASMPMSGFSCLPNARSVPGGNPFAAVLPSQAHQ